MKTALSLTGLLAAALLAVTLLPHAVERSAAPSVDQVALDAQIDARLHARLAKLAQQAKDHSELAAR
jgi:hypothetical protein